MDAARRTLDPVVAHLLDIAAAGHPRPAIELVLDLVADGMGTDEVITGVLAPVQLEVGARWEENLWSVADEHAATAAIDGALGALALSAAVPEHRGTVLVACAEGEHHTLPARMGAERLRNDGWSVTFLGGSLPADDLQRYAAVTEPDVVVVSCTVPLFLAGARRCLAAIADLGLPTVAAGQAFGHDDLRARRLGASGWLDPALSPTIDLQQLRSHPARPEPAPAEALAIELVSDDLRQACLATMRRRWPQAAAGSREQRARGVDVGHIIGYLTTSIDLREDALFSSFTAWQARLLEHRGLPSGVLTEVLEVLSEVASAAGLPEAARLCAAHLDGARS